MLLHLGKNVEKTPLTPTHLRQVPPIIRPVASFGCQIWGVNFLDISKGVDGNDLERIHLSYLRHVLGVGMNIAGDILRAESSSPPYHVHWTKLIFRLWNSLQSNNNIMAHDICKDNHFVSKRVPYLLVV